MAGALALIVLAAACRPADPVRIGFVGGLTGRVADLGVNGRNGAQLAIDRLNAAGKQRYELLVEDDGQDANQVRAAVQSLAQRRVAFVVGPMTSAMAVAAVPETERLKLVMISPTANTTELSGRNDHFFRVIADTHTGARQLAEALSRRGVRSLAMLLDTRNRAYAESFANSCSERFIKLGGRLAVRLNFESGAQADFAALSRTLLREPADAVLVVAGTGDAALAAQQLRQLSPGVQIAVSPWVTGEQLIQMGGHAVEGAVVPQAIDRESTEPGWLDFRREYRARFGEEPGSGATNGYNAVMLGAEALRRAGDPARLRDTLAHAGVEWPGLQRPIVLDTGGDDISPIFISEVRHGRLVSAP